MFRKILIANRGEIACRVIKTARRMGIISVAVYSDADTDGRHVRLADEALRIGPAAARESYLDGARILHAAKNSGAEAVHPGYGFLSENAEFAESCAAAGLTFIGPPPSAIRAMGLKAAAKALMEKAGVPLTPGYHGDTQDPAFLAKQAASIGFPVLIKASAGGGGKGMRRVDRAADFDAALVSCRREAANAFGDDRVLIEKFIVKPRHIEFQVFGDSFGNVIHLFERDCSVQRRHQKVLEEAPAPGMTSERRAAMGAAAVKAARAVGYVGAGTVEFIVAQDGGYAFMEMNTRLQVEHPVTEMITGLDLVEWQLRVASGEPLPLNQDQLRMTGHAIEARIYAEDPDTGFLPSTGRLVHFSTPMESDRVRIDGGIERGDTITPFYDPMIAKLIVSGDDRPDALTRLQAALAEVHIVGIKSNVAFLSRLIATPSFTTADLDTGLIEREAANLAPTSEPIPDEVILLAALAELLADQSEAAAYAGPDRWSPWRARDGWRLNGQSARTLTFTTGEAVMSVAAVARGDAWELSGPGVPATARGRIADDGLLHSVLGHRQLSARVVPLAGVRHVFRDGRHFALARTNDLNAGGATEAVGGGLRARMPGRIVALLVAPGAAVAKGTPLLVMEAMKMEQTLSAPGAGIVAAFRCAVGDQVSEGAELVEFQPEP